MGTHRRWTAVLFALLSTSFAHADEWPDDSGYMNVKSLGAKGDGVTDDTDALQQAFRSEAVYLPAGTYLVRGLSFQGKRIDVQGAGAKKTTIRLKDGSAAEEPLLLARIPCALRDLTIDIGSGNPRAIGILAGHRLFLRNVDFRSSDAQKAGRAAVHVRDTAEMIVMCQVDIDGFDVGVSSDHSASFVAAEHLALHHQSFAGVRRDDGLTAIRGLTSQQMKSPSVVGAGRLWLSDAYMGGIAEAAVDWKGPCYARKISTEGYRNSLKIDGELDSEASVDEYIQKFKNPADAPKTGFTLPVEETPNLPTGGTWVSVKAYGAKGDGATDDTAAIQNAIDAGEPIVYLPVGNYRIDGAVKLRGNLQRLCGMNSTVGLGADSGSVFQLEDGKPTTVTLDRLRWAGGKDRALIEHVSARTCVLRSVTARAELYRPTAADPRLFLEDVNAPIQFFKKCTVFGRGVRNLILRTDGGTSWLFGFEGHLMEQGTSGRDEIVGSATTFSVSGARIAIFGSGRANFGLGGVSHAESIDGLYVNGSAD